MVARDRHVPSVVKLITRGGSARDAISPEDGARVAHVRVPIARTQTSTISTAISILQSLLCTTPAAEASSGGEDEAFGAHSMSAVVVRPEAAANLVPLGHAPLRTVRQANAAQVGEKPQPEVRHVVVPDPVPRSDPDDDAARGESVRDRSDRGDSVRPDWT